MSSFNKHNLWQKIKQLLIAKTSPTADTDARHDKKSSPTDTTINDGDTENKHIENDNIIGNSVENNIENNAENVIEPNSDDEFSKNSFTMSDNISIVEYLKEYFHDKDWHYTYYRPKSSDSQQSHHLSLRMINKDIDCGYLFRVQENNSLLAIYGILPFLIPDSHLSAAMLLMTQINYDMLIGNLEMDINDGEIRYKNAIDIEAVGIDDHIIEHLLQSVVAMTTVAYEIFSDLVNTENPTSDIQSLLDELRQQVDARTFFLPTQYVQ